MNGSVEWLREFSPNEYPRIQRQRIATLTRLNSICRNLWHTEGLSNHDSPHFGFLAFRQKCLVKTKSCRILLSVPGRCDTVEDYCARRNLRVGMSPRC